MMRVKAIEEIFCGPDDRGCFLKTVACVIHRRIEAAKKTYSTVKYDTFSVFPYCPKSDNKYSRNQSRSEYGEPR
jgi:hypothetical protein